MRPLCNKSLTVLLLLFLTIQTLVFESRPLWELLRLVEQKEDDSGSLPLWSTTPKLVILQQNSSSSTTIFAKKEAPIQNYNPHFVPDDPSVVAQFEKFKDPSLCKCRTCCTNMIVTSHKMGSTMVKELWKTVFRQRTGHTSWGYRGIGFDIARKYNGDVSIKEIYREVVVVRNFVDALVSGYLYHKSGRECWLTPNGVPSKTWTYRDCVGNWWRRVRHANATGILEPFLLDTKDETTTTGLPQNTGTTLCHVLQNVTLQQGVIVYMDFALNLYYASLLQHPARMEALNMTNSTLYICYEELYRPETRYQAVDEMRRWFTHEYSNNKNSNNNTINTPLRVVDPRRYAARYGRLDAAEDDIDMTRIPTDKSYSGPHTVDQSATIRSQVRRVVETMDEIIFDGVYAKADEWFGCGGR